VVATITRLAPGKGAEIFVQSAAHVAERLPEVRFWIVGDGPSRERVADDITARGFADRIELLGRRSDVPQLLADVDIVVRMIDQDAVYREGIPRTLIESMAAGKAVIGADLGGIPEIIDPEVNGLLVPPDDPQALGEAILRVCSDAQLRGRLGAAAAQSVGERFDHRTMVREIEAEYVRLAKKKGVIPVGEAG
jgi:glycosyltransferase involved in cell wall biosynthesis